MYVFIWEQNKTDEKQLDEHVASKTLHNKREEKDSDSHIAPNIWYFFPVGFFFFFFLKDIKFQSDFSGDPASRITFCKVFPFHMLSETWSEAPIYIPSMFSKQTQAHI